jgi:hypothetical protein
MSIYALHDIFTYHLYRKPISIHYFFQMNSPIIFPFIRNPTRPISNIRLRVLSPKPYQAYSSPTHQRTFSPTAKMSTGQPSETARAQKESLDPTAHTQNPQDLGIENTNINTAAGVSLSPEQKTLIGSVLDLFAGRPSLKKLQLWTDDARFSDPLTKAEGRKQYEAQWYGLQSAFSEIERLGHEVTGAGEPIRMDLKTRYKVKGVGKEQVIESGLCFFLLCIGFFPLVFGEG